MVTVSPSGNTTAAVTYTPIATNTLSSTAYSVTFSSISGAYTDLVLVIYNGAANPASLNLTVNSDSGSNYGTTWVLGNGTAAQSSKESSGSRIFLGENGPTAATPAGVVIINFMNYSNTTTYKTVLSRLNRTDNKVYATVGNWRSTSAINSVTITLSELFCTGSTFTLYGIGA